MSTDCDKEMENRVQRLVERAFKRLFKRIASEPTLVIESGDDKESVSSRALAEIRQWLFRGR